MAEPDPVKLAELKLAAMGEGYRARRAGQPRDANPYSIFRPEQEEWDRGWQHADREQPHPR